MRWQRTSGPPGLTSGPELSGGRQDFAKTQSWTEPVIGLVAVSRFLPFPIQNFGKKSEKWPPNVPWRARPASTVGGLMREVARSRQSMGGRGQPRTPAIDGKPRQCGGSALHGPRAKPHSPKTPAGKPQAFTRRRRPPGESSSHQFSVRSVPNQAGPPTGKPSRHGGPQAPAPTGERRPVAHSRDSPL